MGKAARNAQVARLLLDAAEYLSWKGWTSTDGELLDDKREQVSALGALEWAALGNLAVRAESVLSMDIHRPLNDLITFAVQELADVVEPRLHFVPSGSVRDIVAYWNDWTAKGVHEVQAALREAAYICDPSQVSSVADVRGIAGAEFDQYDDVDDDGLLGVDLDDDDWSDLGDALREAP